MASRVLIELCRAFVKGYKGTRRSIWWVADPIRLELHRGAVQGYLQRPAHTWG
jgi:hypothetical protein